MPTPKYISSQFSSHSGADIQAIIYVIDSSDHARLPTSRSELLTMLSEDELKSVPVLVFANKQDVPGALKPGDISDKLGLAGGEKGREWSVRGSCALKGEGLEEGLDWCVFFTLRSWVREVKLTIQAGKHNTEIGQYLHVALWTRQSTHSY
jgi:signal recognition particle receptor subunit beta